MFAHPTFRLGAETFKAAALSAFVLLALHTPAPSAAPMQPAADFAPVWRTDATGTRTEIKPLLNLVPGGQAKSVKLTGLVKNQFFDFGVRSDDVISRADLELSFTASPSVLDTTSQLNIYLNGQLQQTAVLTKDMIGKPSKLVFSLNPKSMQTMNQVSIEFVGHIQSTCENPADDALWLNINAQSRLVLEKQRIRLGSDMGKLPAPFIDTATGDPTVLPVVFPSAPSAAMKTAAALTASWAGRLAYWRGADFPVYFNEAPAGEHFVVFVTNPARPNFSKDFPKVEGTQISVADAPNSLAEKMLIVAGRDDADLIAAMKALGRGSSVMIGDTFKPAAQQEPERRKAYDAPRWLDTDQKVPFSRLIEYSGQLTAKGYAMPPVHLPVRLAPDLFMVDNATLEMKVDYRASKPMKDEAGQFRALVNGRLIDSDPLPTKDGHGSRVISLPGFYGALFNNTNDALALAQTNDFTFEMHYERTYEGGSPENCKSIMVFPHQFEVEPTSTLEISGLYHYARMPNLKLFTQTGYPFTRYADLAETAVLIADNAEPQSIRAMLNAVGRMSAATGAFGNRIAVTGNPADPILKDRDVLLVGAMPALLADINEDDALKVQEETAKAFKAGQFPKPPQQSIFAPGVGVLSGFKSPLSSEHSVVALLAEGEAGAVVLADALGDAQGLAAAGGSTTVVSADGLAAFSVGDRYAVGNLPVQHQIWMRLSQHPGWLVFFALISAAIIGFAAFFLMRRWVGRRA